MWRDSFYVALHGASPAFPHSFDQRYLALMGWGFLVPFVWGFSAKWMRVFPRFAVVAPARLGRCGSGQRGWSDSDDRRKNVAGDVDPRGWSSAGDCGDPYV